MLPRTLLGLLLLAAVLALAAACGGDDGGLIGIKRYDLTADEPWTFEEIYDPPFAFLYPDVVAEVNGEPITGKELAARVAEHAGSRWQYLSGQYAEQTGAPPEIVSAQLAKLDESDPLEELIDRELLRQAAIREGLLPSYDEAVAYTREQEGIFVGRDIAVSPDGGETPSLLELMGFPAEDWASDAEIVERYREHLGVTELRLSECDVDRGEFDRIRDVDCTGFLRQERERAEIVYYARWVD